MANDSEFGLGSGLFTSNLARAHRVSSQLRAGICWVNTYRAISPIAPFGGFNQSGYGREAGMESILDYTVPAPPGSTHQTSRWPILLSCARFFFVVICRELGSF